MSLNLRTKELKTKELIELFYQSYNPITSRYQKIDKIELANLEDLEEGQDS